ncbi:MAG TPA: asparagine synthase (glutamine-hydrolyzing) [Chitinophagales bacterium]|nr:asparagine synthase (glutamine-hydrolyzing) [Chitinophagales bacterium]
MCGISGWLSLNKSLDKDAFKQATNKLAHRGPESFGFYFNENNTLALGHRRLKIIDLSDASAQPFYSACGRYVINYNGEIYNFKEIARDLQLTLKTSGDTEVIIEAFAKIGTAAFTLLNGIFAFSIYDIHADKLYLCRDRIGIKPLYYYFDGIQFAFASEIKALKAMPNLHMPINKAALAEFLHIGFLTEPDTAFQQVWKFPAGNFVEIDVKSLNNNTTFPFTAYWNLYQQILPNTHSNEAEVEKKLEELLIASIASQMISDVPLGTFLSGGIDSSLITALASKIKKDKIKTFSIGFQNNQFDETIYAEKVAKELGTDHYAYRMGEVDLEEILHEIIDTYDEPFADSSAFPTMFVSKQAKKQVTVSLSGDGGDELFMGYGMHQWASRLDNPFVRVFRKPFYMASQCMSFRYKRAAWLLNYDNHDHVASHIFSQEQYLFSEKDLKHYLVNPTFNFDDINAIATSKRNLSSKERQSFWDLQYYLKDDLLVKVDRATMLYSLESRVPFLDNDVIDYTININEHLKYKNGEAKYILKKILYKYLPKELFNRPKKGFAMPLSHWLSANFKFLIDKYLSPIVINRYDIVSNLHVAHLKNRFFAGEDYLYARIWSLVILHWWLEENA